MSPHPSTCRAARQPFVNLAAEGLRRGRRARFQVTGSAMDALVHDGEWVTVEPIPAACVTLGDLLLAPVAGVPMVRRVAAITPRRGRYESEFVASFTLVNDDRWSDGAAVEATDILGRVVSVDRGGRTVPLGGSPAPRPAGGALRRRRLVVRLLLGAAALATLVIFGR